MTKAEIPSSMRLETAAVAQPPRRFAARRLAFLVAALSLAGAASVVAYHQYRQRANSVEQAQARLHGGDPAAARRLLLSALHRRPNDPEALWLLGRADLSLGDPVAAEHDLRQASGLGVSGTRLRLPLAAALLAQSKSREALDLLVTDCAPPAELPGILLARANGLRQLHDLAGAEAAIDEAGRMAPELIDVPLASAALALARRDLARADEDADHALFINGRSADALLLKARLMELRGQRSGALNLLSKVLVADPRAFRVRQERARILLSIGRMAEAVGDVDVVLAAEPANTAAIYLKVNLLMEARDYAAADSLLQTILRFVPDLPRGWYTVAKVKLNLEQPEPAEEAIEKYLAQAPDDIDGRKLQARIGLAAKRPDKALEALSRITMTGAADAETFDLLGVAREMTGRFAQAETNFARAAGIAPDNPGIQAHLGVARLILGDGPGAIEALERSLSLAPAQPDVGKHLVVAAFASGKPERAAKFLAVLRQRGGETASSGQLEALLALARFDPSDAASRLTGLAAKYPDDRAVQWQLIRVLLMLGRIDDAEASLVRVLAQEPADEEALHVLIPLLERSGRTSRAAAILEAALVAAPGKLTLRLTLAGLYARAGDHGKARAVLSDDAVRHETWPAFLLSRAAMEQGAGDPAAARETYEGLLRSAPAQPYIAVRFAEFLVTRGALDEAAQTLASALAASPGNPDLQRALVLQRYRVAGLDAALVVAEALRRDPANMPTAASLRGDLLSADGRQADAAEAYLAELTKAPSSLLAMQAAAAVNAAHGPVPAVRLLRTWIQAHSDDLSARAMLSSMLTAARLPAAAATVLESLRAHWPNDTRLMNNLALAYFELGDPRAYPLALRAYLSTFDPPAADTLGCILLADGRTREALTLLRFAARELPDDLPIRLHLARAVRKAGLTDEARALLVGLTKQEFDGREDATRMLADLETQSEFDPSPPAE